MNNPLAVRGFVTLTSKDLLENEPNEFSIGGFRVDGVTFDWNEASLIKSYDASGRLVLDWQLRDFNSEFFIDSNNGATTIDWDKVLTGKIEDILFEAEFIDPNGGEDAVTPRICVARTIEGCLTSAPFGSLYLEETLEGTEFLLKIFEIDVAACGLTENDVLTPRDLYEQHNVSDALITGEYWLLHDIIVPNEQQRIVRITSYNDDGEPTFVLPFEQRTQLVGLGIDVVPENDVAVYAAYHQLFKEYPASYCTITNVEFVDVTPNHHLLGGNLHEQRHPAL